MEVTRFLDSNSIFYFHESHRLQCIIVYNTWNVGSESDIVCFLLSSMAKAVVTKTMLPKLFLSPVSPQQGHSMCASSRGSQASRVMQSVRDTQSLYREMCKHWPSLLASPLFLVGWAV